MRLRKRALAELCVGIVLLLVSIKIAHYSLVGDRGFDSRKWRESPGRVARYRMHRDLIRRMNSERWDYTRTIGELGVPSITAHRFRLEYFMGSPPWDAPWTLHVGFDDNGQLPEVTGYPQ